MSNKQSAVLQASYIQPPVDYQPQQNYAQGQPMQGQQQGYGQQVYVQQQQGYQSQIYYQQPPPQQQRPPTVVYVQQPQVIQHQYSVILPLVTAQTTYPTQANGCRYSTQIRCPHCNAVGYTIAQNEKGCGAWTWIILLFLFCFPWCIIPWCCTNSCDDTKHLCQSCRQCVGVREYQMC